MGHRGTVAAHAHKHGHARIHLCNTITQPSLPAPSAGVSTTKYSWRMLLTTQTQAPSRSILCIFPSCTHMHTHRVTRLPVPCSKLSALHVCMSGYRDGNSIPFLSCKIHCAEPPPSTLQPSLLLHPTVPQAWGGVNLSLSLCLQKCPFFRCSRKL